MNEQDAVKELKRIAYSLFGAMVSAALLAGLNWVGAHIPEVVTFITSMAGAYGTQKLTN